MLSLSSSLFAVAFGAVTSQIALGNPLTAVDDLQPVRQYDPDHMGAVASENSICTNIGTALLKKGGNAADALVGTALCVGVIGMYHGGIGGGGFMLVRAPDGSYEDIDFRETMPAAGFQDMYNNDTNASIYGGAASGVPSELRGLEYLHSKYGVLPWEMTVTPAVEVARYGWPVTNDLIRYMSFATHSGPDFLCNDANWAMDFCPNGTRLGFGDTITRKRYANTLETIAQQGPDVFYTGTMAQTMINALNAASPEGIMTLDDLRNYKVALRKPSHITYRGYKLTSNSAPSSGGVALAAMKTVEGYDDFFHPANVNLSTHRLDEAIRFAYAARAELGDPFFLPGMDLYQSSMLSSNTSASIRARISDTHTLNVSAYDPKGLESLDTPGTSHIATADASGMAISFTTTINLLFGNQVLVPETGIIMNNENNDFSIPHVRNEFGYIPSPSNYIRPGKRPLSSITPVIVEYPNGTLYYIIGAAGGSRIITATIQNLVNVLDRNMTTAESLAEPRMHDQLIPNQAVFEYPPFGYDNKTVAYMKSLGHNVSWTFPGWSSAHGIRRLPNGTFEAAGEPRQKDSAGFTV